MEARVARSNSNKRRLTMRLWNLRYLYMLVIPGVIWLAIFSYAPMYGVIIAFKEYNVGLGIMQSPWVGLKYFYEIINDPYFMAAIRNTLFFSVLGLLTSFPIPILFALSLNEVVGAPRFKKTVQTMSYLPYFLSWAFVASFLISFLSDTGVLNTFLKQIGVLRKGYAFLSNPSSFVWVILLSAMWKSYGFGSIIYLSAITSINPELYESAMLDGASRFRRIWHITLPSIRPTIVVLLILQISTLMSSNFEQFFLLQNARVREIASVIDVYTYEVGFQKARMSYGTMVGLFKSVVSAGLLIMANAVATKITGDGIF